MAAAFPKTCYACNKEATGVEHVPPRCLFPKSPEFRKDLLTVPSCDKHNAHKSLDDELLRHVLVMAPENNDLAIKVLDDSVLPSFDRRPHIVETFLPKITPVKTKEYETASCTIDVARFESSIRSIVKGLYFLTFGEVLYAKMSVAWGALMFPSLAQSPFLSVINYAEKVLPPMDGGANPKIFCYSIGPWKDGSTFLCRLRFYEGLPIYVRWRHRGWRPSR